jgi:hypothetical protein
MDTADGDNASFSDMSQSTREDWEIIMAEQIKFAPNACSIIYVCSTGIMADFPSTA